MKSFLFHSFIVLRFFVASLDAQQLYSGNTVFACNSANETGPSPAVLYSCNGEKLFCQAFMIFISQPKYNSAATISKLTSSDPQKLAQVNNISSSALLPLDREIIVPVNCSCSGQYYQANASYITRSVYDTYFSIANDTYEGLSTCDVLIQQNPYGALDLRPGFNLRIPLRCACPTKNQTDMGVKFLLTYLVTWKDNITNISERFNVSKKALAKANGFSDEDAILYPFTTILIPLETEPSSSQTRLRTAPVVPPPPRLMNRHHKSNRGTYIGVAIGGSLSAVAGSFYLLFLYCRGGKVQKASRENKEEKKMWKLPESVLDNVIDGDQILKVYEFEELEAATDNFSSEKRLSDSVYRGILRGKLLAIKKMSRDVSKEVAILNKIYHFNLISLYGLCEHNGIHYLVYEYLENGSLKEWLQRKDCPGLQSWIYRICIALDVANGLDYLHNFTAPGYVHKDINSGNILLNGDLRAKIANFHFARSADRGENGNSSTTFVLGAKGYMAPEYLETGVITPKVDVYAFGVVLLELITGREAVFNKQDEGEVLLSKTVFSIMDATDAENALRELIDPRLQVKHPLGYIIDQTELALHLLKLSVACLEQEPARRLSMQEVVSTLMKVQVDAQVPESLSVE